MHKLVAIIIALIVYGCLCYSLGSSNREIKIVTKEIEGKTKGIEVVRYETKYQIKEVCSLMAKPNFNDNDIIQLYDKGKL